MRAMKHILLVDFEHNMYMVVSTVDFENITFVDFEHIRLGGCWLIVSVHIWLGVAIGCSAPCKSILDQDDQSLLRRTNCLGCNAASVYILGVGLSPMIIFLIGCISRLFSSVCNSGSFMVLMHYFCSWLFCTIVVLVILSHHLLVLAARDKISSNKTIHHCVHVCNGCYCF